MTYLIAALVSIVAFIVAFVAIKYLTDAGKNYKDGFENSVKGQLSDMFIFIDSKQLLMITVGSAAAVFLSVWLFGDSILFAVVMAVMVGMTPGIIITILEKRRHKRILTDLPDALLSMSNMMKSGSNMNTALEMVVTETPGPIGQEFGLFLRELKIGVDHNEALDNLAKRVPLPDMQLVVAGMKISREIGGSIAEILHKLADTVRKRLEMEGKISALTAQGKYQGYVMALLPIVVGYAIFQIEPVAMSKLFTEQVGWVVCIVIFVMAFTGHKFIQKIVNIDV